MRKKTVIPLLAYLLLIAEVECEQKTFCPPTPDTSHNWWDCGHQNNDTQIHHKGVEADRADDADAAFIYGNLPMAKVLDRNSNAHPAASCHLTFPSDSRTAATCRDWELRNSVTVAKSHPDSFFMVIGYGGNAGGYSGIQDTITENGNGRRVYKRIAIFSLWHDGHNKVELVKKSNAAKVEGFDGEGTGLQTKMDLDWREGEIVTFIVRGRRVGNAWEVSCRFKFRERTYFMSTYRRSGKRIGPGRMNSFLEDWYGWHSSGTASHLVARRAEFSNPTLKCRDDGYVEKLTKAEFTKVERGKHGLAARKAIGGVVQQKRNRNTCAFFLHTGGAEPGPGYMANWTPLQCARRRRPRTRNVSCGLHKASSCSKCGPNASYCNGDCFWNGRYCAKKKTSRPRRRTTTKRPRRRTPKRPRNVSCGLHKASSCSKCGPNASYCNGDCFWNGRNCTKWG